MRHTPLLGLLSELIAGTVECGTDGVLGDAQCLADLAIALAFEVVQSDHLGFLASEPIEHVAHFLFVFNSLFR